MGIPKSFLPDIKRYPYRERLPFAVIMLCLLAWMAHKDWPFPYRDLIPLAALCVVVFLDRNGRPFWFMWGVVVGTVLYDLLPYLHSFLVH